MDAVPAKGCIGEIGVWGHARCAEHNGAPIPGSVAEGLCTVGDRRSVKDTGQQRPVVIVVNIDFGSLETIGHHEL